MITLFFFNKYTFHFSSPALMTCLSTYEKRVICRAENYEERTAGKGAHNKKTALKRTVSFI